MITEIGITAGEVWKLLDEKGGRLELAAIIKQRMGKEDLILMALGWLCREGHVLIMREGERILVKLRECGSK